MAYTIEQLRNRFNASSVTLKFIWINVIVFIVVRIIAILVMLCGNNPSAVMQWIGLPSAFRSFITRPWTILTYMIMHFDMMHLLFNMICLYCFGRLFQSLCTVRQFVALYIIGGLLGGLCFMLAFSLFPYYSGNQAMLLGASASVMSIVVADALLMPDYSFRLLLIGDIKLKWIALVVIILSVLSLGGDNDGGAFAHIGGAASGALYALCHNRGIDITRRFNIGIDLIVNLFRKTKSTKNRTDLDIDDILNKIKHSGYGSLSEDERKRLFYYNKQSQR